MAMPMRLRQVWPLVERLVTQETPWTPEQKLLMLSLLSPSEIQRVAKAVRVARAWREDVEARVRGKLGRAR